MLVSYAIWKYYTPKPDWRVPYFTGPADCEKDTTNYSKIRK